MKRLRNGLRWRKQPLLSVEDPDGRAPCELEMRFLRYFCKLETSFVVQVFVLKASVDNHADGTSVEIKPHMYSIGKVML